MKPMEFSCCIRSEFKAFFLYDTLCLLTHCPRDLYCASCIDTLQCPFSALNAHSWSNFSFHECSRESHAKPMESSCCMRFELKAFLLYSGTMGQQAKSVIQEECLELKSHTTTEFHRLHL